MGLTIMCKDIIQVCKSTISAIKMYAKVQTFLNDNEKYQVQRHQKLIDACQEYLNSKQG